MKIAVYSGTFNPLHKGHLAIMRYLTEEAGFDAVYLIVTPMNPFKEGKKQPSGEERYQAATEAVSRHPELKVKVLDIELKMAPPQYTVKTLDVLREKEPQNEFTLVIGADNLAGFAGWRYHERILLEYGVVVFPRKGYHRGHDKARLLRENPDYRIRLLKAPLVTISSTEIRKGLAAGKDMSRWLM
jgi:nicotinate-nucleotide adenylyltransferase